MQKELDKQILITLRDAENIYVIMSQFTNMPFVVCDKETYDDEVLLFVNEEDAKAKGKEVLEEKQPIKIMSVDKKNRLAFYTSLLPTGVNCLLLDRGKKGQTRVQLQDLIRRQVQKGGTMIVENPQFQLTALYFMQEMRKNPTAEMSDEIKELHEEMMIHYQEGKYIIAMKEGQGMLMMKQKNGQSFQPVFTDIQEYRKLLAFHKEKDLKTVVLPAAKIPEILSAEATGVVVNPYGVNLQLKVNRTKKA